jgi:hypothetical protein
VAKGVKAVIIVVEERRSPAAKMLKMLKALNLEE